MAKIEVCDICRAEVNDTDGIELIAKDFNGLSICGFEPVRSKRKYTIRICDKCIEKIKEYCKSK